MINASGVVTNLRPPADASAIVRKLGSMTLLSEEEIDFLEGLQNNTVNMDPKVDFIVDGEDLAATFVVQEGWAVRYVGLPSGKRQILSFALPGDMLGVHVNFKRKASYSAAAQTSLRLAAIDPIRHIEIHQKYPLIASGISWCTAREFAILGDQAVRLGRLAAHQRILHLFLELWHRLRLIGETDKNEFVAPLTQEDIADTLGLSLVHTNRQLQKLRKDGLISFDQTRVTLHGIERLIDIAEFDPEHLKGFTL